MTSVQWSECFTAHYSHLSVILNAVVFAWLLSEFQKSSSICVHIQWEIHKDSFGSKGQCNWAPKAFDWMESDQIKNKKLHAFVP